MNNICKVVGVFEKSLITKYFEISNGAMVRGYAKCKKNDKKCEKAKKDKEREERIIRHRKKCSQGKCRENCKPVCPVLDKKHEGECKPCDKDIKRRKAIPEREICPKPDWK